METDILQRKGKAINYLSLNEIENKHIKSLELEPIIYETKLSKINLIDNKTILLNNNTEIKINETSFNDILNINNFNTKISSTFNKILKDKEKTISLLNNFKNESIKNNGDKEILLVASKHDKEIINVLFKHKDFNIINNDDFLKTTYRIIKQHNLKITDFYIDAIGQISINTMVDDDKPFLINGLDSKFGIVENENFHRGFTFISNISESKIIPSTIRILCSNQITLANHDDMLILKNLNTQTVRKTEEYFNNYKKINYVPNSFIKQVKQAFITPASLNEYESAIKTIAKNSELSIEDLNNYINYDEIKEAFKYYSEKNNVTLTEQFKKQTPTNKTIWEVINSMTYIASNLAGSQIKDEQRKNIFIESGKFLRGDSKNGMFDLQLQFNTPFAKKWF